MESINNQIKALFLLYACSADLFHYRLPSSAHINHYQNKCANTPLNVFFSNRTRSICCVTGRIILHLTRLKRNARRCLLSSFSTHHFCLSHPTQHCRWRLPLPTRSCSIPLDVERSECDFSKGVGPRPGARGWACSEGSSKRFHLHCNVPEGCHGPRREAALS